VEVKIQPHPYFERQGRTLLIEIPIPLAIAIFGGEISVPTWTGRVKMKIPQGTQAGKIFRLRGKGFPSTKGFGKGDQHVKIHVETPTHLNEQQIEAIKRFEKNTNSENYPLLNSFSKQFKKK